LYFHLHVPWNQLFQVWFVYHGYVGQVVRHEIFRQYCGSLGLLLNHFTHFFKRGLASICGLIYCPCLPKMLGFDCSCIYHLFPTGWSPYFFQCNGTYQDWCFPLPIGTIGYPNFITPSCPFLGPSFWESCSIILFSFTSFFNIPL